MKDIGPDIFPFISSGALRQCWQRAPLYKSDVLTLRWEERDFLQTLALEDHRQDSILVIKDGHRLNGGARESSASHLRHGRTVVLNDAHFLLPWLVPSIDCFQKQFLFPCGVNLYATPALSRGFLAHFDPHDVFIFQLIGEKNWTVFPPDINLPLQWEIRPVDVVGRNPWADVVLKAGDALYLPRGWIHEATSGGAMSVHVTFAVHSVSYAELLLDVIMLAIEKEPALRECLGVESVADIAPRLRNDITDIGQQGGRFVNVVEDCLRSVIRDFQQRIAANVSQCGLH